MIEITGNVRYTITIDPTIWIFDDRKILLHDLLTGHMIKQQDKNEETLNKQWDQATYQQKIQPPINKSIGAYEDKQDLTDSYVMPIKQFIEYAEVNKDTDDVLLATVDGDMRIPLVDLYNSHMLFAVNGKPIQDKGPVHLYLKDVNEQIKIIKGVKRIFMTTQT